MSDIITKVVNLIDEQNEAKKTDLITDLKTALASETGDDNRKTALMYALEKIRDKTDKSYNIVELLINNIAQLKIQDAQLKTLDIQDKNGKTALMYASENVNT